MPVPEGFIPEPPVGSAPEGFIPDVASGAQQRLPTLQAQNQQPPSYDTPGFWQSFLQNSGIPHDASSLASYGASVAFPFMAPALLQTGGIANSAAQGHYGDAATQAIPGGSQVAMASQQAGEGNWGGLAGTLTPLIAMMAAGRAIGGNTPARPTGEPIYGNTEAHAGLSLPEAFLKSVPEMLVKRIPVVGKMASDYMHVRSLMKGAERPVVGYNMYKEPIGPPQAMPPMPQKPATNNPMGAVFAGHAAQPPIPVNGPALEAYSTPPPFSEPAQGGVNTILNASPLGVTKAAGNINSQYLPGENPPPATPPKSPTEQMAEFQKAMEFMHQLQKAVKGKGKPASKPASGGAGPQVPKGKSNPFPTTSAEELGTEGLNVPLHGAYQQAVRERPTGWAAVPLDRTRVEGTAPNNWLRPEEMALIREAILRVQEDNPQASKLLSRIEVHQHDPAHPQVIGMTRQAREVGPASLMRINLLNFRNYLQAYGLDGARALLEHELTHTAQNFLKQGVWDKTNVPAQELKNTNELNALIRESKVLGKPAVPNVQHFLTPFEIKHGPYPWRANAPGPASLPTGVPK